MEFVCLFFIWQDRSCHDTLIFQKNLAAFPNVTSGLEPISYTGVLLSTLLHATVYVFTQFAECAGTDCK
jgi:hypothetical protein